MLLGDDTGVGSVMLKPIRVQCVGVGILTALPYIYIYIYICVCVCVCSDTSANEDKSFQNHIR